MSTETEKAQGNFIVTAVEEDLESGRFERPVVTRFPPEPNGFLHIGHVKAICINFGIGERFGGPTHLRFDDTNPVKEEQRYIDAIKEDIAWLGFDWGEHEYYASDYFQQLYEWAVKLIEDGKAYVDDQTIDEIREHRGTLTRPGVDSPYRDRSVEENLDLFERMKAGEFEDGSKVLRAKIDMGSPNMNFRDPVMYRILKATHHRTGDDWCIYPMYDYAHGQSDSYEKITHSLCSIEFEDHRPLYEWFIEALGIFPSRQIEFARLNVTHVITSKRKLRQLVEEGIVDGWDDPRMPTVAAMRRRGYPAMAIREFCDGVGVAKRPNTIDYARLEFHVREHLNKRANRVMAVLDPLKVVIENYPEGQVEKMEAVNNPEDEGAGVREVPFSRELYIERADFMEDPPKKFFRLGPGREVRLRYGYWVTCTDVIKDESGEVVELRCTYDPETRGGNSPPDGRKVKGTLHWVSAAHALDAKVNLYEHLLPEDPSEGGGDEDWIAGVNQDSLKVVEAKVEPVLGEAKAGEFYQFERTGYFTPDTKSTEGGLVFNRTVGLRDTWAKMQKKG